MLTLATFLLGIGPAAADSFTIEECGFATDVEDFASGGSDGDVSIVVQNPWQAEHFAQVDDSTARTWFDFLWSAESGWGSFDIAAAHEAEDVGGSGLFSRSFGGMLVNTLSDLSLDIDAAYTYNTPATYFDVLLLISVSREEPYEALFIGSRHGGPMAGHPPAGTLTIDGDVILPAGDSYWIEYTMEVFSFGGDTGILGTGSGNIALNLTPEPTSLTLLAMFTLILARRRHRYARV